MADVRPAPTADPTAGRSGLASLRRRWPVVALVVWSAYVWTTRIVNAWGDASAALTTKVAATVVSGLLLAAAAIVAMVLVARRTRPLGDEGVAAVRALAGATVVVWFVRGVQILVADYSTGDPTSAAFQNPTGFKVVHLLLGAVAVALALLSLRVASREAAGRDLRQDGAPR